MLSPDVGAKNTGLDSFKPRPWGASGMARKQMSLVFNGSDGDDSLQALGGKQSERRCREMWIIKGPVSWQPERIWRAMAQSFREDNN